MADHGIMVALGGHPPDSEPDMEDGDEEEDTGPAPEHDLKHEAMDIIEALKLKGVDPNELAHTLEHFVKACRG